MDDLRSVSNPNGVNLHGEKDGVAREYYPSFKPQRGKFTLLGAKPKANNPDSFKPQRGKFTRRFGKVFFI